MTDKTVQQNEMSMDISRRDCKDEIDFNKISSILLDQRWVVLSIVSLCIVISYVTTQLLPEYYRAKVIVMPPLPESSEQLNVYNYSIQSVEKETVVNTNYLFQVTPEELYKEFIGNLQSSRIRRNFFDENELIASFSGQYNNLPDGQVFMDEFNNKLSISGIDKRDGDPGLVTINLEGKNPELVADWLNKFVHLADKETVDSFAKKLSVKVQRKKDSIMSRINSSRAIEKSRRLDEIARLKEAAVIAEKLGWTNGPAGNVQVKNNNLENVKRSFFLQQETPLYWRGSQALHAEIELLKKRQNDDPFIPFLRDLYGQLNFLESIEMETDNVHAMRFEQAASTNDTPVKPKKVLIVIFGFLIGVFLAIIVVLLKSAIISEKLRHTYVSKY